MKVIFAQDNYELERSRNEVKRILKGEVHPIFWKDVIRIAEQYSQILLQDFNISNFKTYAMQCLYAFANAAETMQVCYYYDSGQSAEEKKKAYERIKNDIVTERQFFNPTSYSLSCGAISSMDTKNNTIKFKDRRRLIKFLKCDVCNQEHSAKGRTKKLKDPNTGQETTVIVGADEVGNPCRRTDGCRGHLVLDEHGKHPTITYSIDKIKDVVYKGKDKQSEEGIEEIEHLNNQSIDFSKFLKRAAPNRGNIDQLTLEKSMKQYDQRRQLFERNKEIEQEEILNTQEEQPTNASWKHVVKHLAQIQSFHVMEEPVIEDNSSLVSINALTENDKAKLQDYWSYLDEDYALALIKNY